MKAKNVTHADVGFILMTMITGNFHHFYGGGGNFGGLLVFFGIFVEIKFPICIGFQFQLKISFIFFLREYASSWGRITLKYH